MAKQVDNRYHVSSEYPAPAGHSFEEAVRSRAEAERVALRLSAKEKSREARYWVFDSMARVGSVNLWVLKNSVLVAVSRREKAVLFTA
jgi:hypothetical protein